VHPKLVLAERIPGIKTIEAVDDKFWKRRFRQIRNFERTIHDTGTQILKFFLHISKDEQKKRFLQRIDQKQKHWKFSEADITERKFWDQYQSAYEQAIGNTSTKKNPWFVVPSDDKWFTQMLISKIIISKLEDMKIKYPVADEELEARLSSAKKLLLEEK
jgi:polyphosphate kinase 2 (PPK2 family)